VVLFGTITWQQAGLYESEITLFSHIIAHNPEARHAHLNLSIALYKEGRLEEGLETGRIAMEQRPYSVKAQNNMCVFLKELDQHEEAGRHCILSVILREMGYVDGNLTSRHQSAADARTAISLYEQQRYAEAADLFQQILSRESDPSRQSALLHRIFGQALLKLEQVDEAAIYLKVAAELDPSDHMTLNSLGRAYFLQRQYQEALEVYGDLLELDPDNATSHFNMGATLYHLNRLEEALVSMERALSIDPNLETAKVVLRQVRQALQ